MTPKFLSSEPPLTEGERLNMSLFHSIYFGVFGDREFCFTHIKFELPLMYPSDDVDRPAVPKAPKSLREEVRRLPCRDSICGCGAGGNRLGTTEKKWVGDQSR